jgi:hypothetical protein
LYDVSHPLKQRCSDLEYGNSRYAYLVFFFAGGLPPAQLKNGLGVFFFLEDEPPEPEPPTTTTAGGGGGGGGAAAPAG